MKDIKWSESEKKVARTVFDAAFKRECAATLLKLKELAASATTPQDMWAIHDYLDLHRREIDLKYDYRYAQLIFVFARLLRENWIEEAQLQALSSEKRVYIHGIAAL